MSDTPSELELLGPDSWRDFMSQDTFFLMLGKSDCAGCNTWTEELKGYLKGEHPHGGVRFGKLLLDQRGLTDFKREHGGWLKEVQDLPWNLLYMGGEQKKAWAGGGVDRLTNRLVNLGL